MAMQFRCAQLLPRNYCFSIKLRRIFLLVFTVAFVSLLLNFASSFYFLTRIGGGGGTAGNENDHRESGNIAETNDHQQDQEHDDSSDNAGLLLRNGQNIATNYNCDDMKRYVQDLLTIRISVLTELRALERNRTAVIRQIAQRHAELERIRAQIGARSSELDRMRVYIEQAVIAKRDAERQQRKWIDRDRERESPLSLDSRWLPKRAQQSSSHNHHNDRLSASSAPIIIDEDYHDDGGGERPGSGIKQSSAAPKITSTEDAEHHHCQMYNCFDYSRCSLFAPFNVYIYDIDDDRENGIEDQSSLMMMMRRIFRQNIHATPNATIACVYAYIVPPLDTMHNDVRTNYFRSLQRRLHSLPYWGGDGRNHIIINTNADINLRQIGIGTMRAMLFQTTFTISDYRSKFDLIIPDIRSLLPDHHQTKSFGSSDMDLISSPPPPPLSPARRKYFVSYLGAIRTTERAVVVSIRERAREILLSIAAKHTDSPHNEFLFDFDCDTKTARLCANQSSILLESTFVLILPPSDLSRPSKQAKSKSKFAKLPIYDRDTDQRLLHALSTGAIPVIIGGDYLTLPLDEAIDWSRAAIQIPASRLPEFYLALKSFTRADIIEMRRFGAQIYRSYFSSRHALIDSIFAFVRSIRLQIAAPAPRPIFEYKRKSAEFNQSSNMIMASGSSSASSAASSSSSYRRYIRMSSDDEIVGPLEPPLASLKFRRNLSLILTQRYSAWNDAPHCPWYTFPALPRDPVLPSEARFEPDLAGAGPGPGFRPIGDGAGGSGHEYSLAIGGNFPNEQFTIVILTYEREAILLGALQRLKDLPYLNKVIVVWNSARPPSDAIIWPEIGVDIVVIRARRNSLNNRFLPFDEIETDAVLSLDDDANFRHDEIVFAFKTWRQARDVIVGFPARYHAWNSAHSNWLYNSNYTCEFSMILTGAAFFHKYYAYLYTHIMPAAIRDKVDEFMNCEDIAMNFLVSHISRKPPIKVTSRWTFRCPDCVTSLSEGEQHYQRRHKCMNHFASVYGYMPLLLTQFRADSVLFKTRIPHDKQKCFRHI